MPSTTIGYYDEPYRAPPEGASDDDRRRSLDRLSRRIDIAMNRLDRLESVEVVTDPTTLTPTQRNVFANTDSAAVAITLPAGVDGTYYRIVNTGTSGNNVTITPDGTENLLGANSSFTLFDAEALIIVFSTDDGWW